MSKIFFLFLIIFVFAGCANILEIKDWRLLEPETDLLNSPNAMLENARQNANPVNKFLDSAQNNAKHKLVADTLKIEDSQTLKSNNLEKFVNFPELIEANAKKLTIFTHQPPSDTYKSVSPLSITLELLLDFYQKLISPQLNTSCPFQTSCSRYARKAVRGFGPILGSLMAIDRLFRCNRTAGDKYFIGFRKDAQGNLIYPLTRCFLDEPSNNNIFKKSK